MFLLTNTTSSNLPLMSGSALGVGETREVLTVTNLMRRMEAKGLVVIKVSTKYQPEPDTLIPLVQDNVVQNSSYDLAVSKGFTGSQDAWLSSLTGASAYDIAVSNGFVGTQAAWLLSLKSSNAPSKSTSGGNSSSNDLNSLSPIEGSIPEYLTDINAWHSTVAPSQLILDGGNF